MTRSAAFSGKILVTAGPTVEPLDPVRFISNHSTGTMGYEIAAACARNGFDVCLVSGPVGLEAPAGVKMVNVLTAREMRRAVVKHLNGCGCIVMAAAVCDFSPAKKNRSKIKKRETLTLKLRKTPDILAEIRSRRDIAKVGFALETHDALRNARAKLRAKKLDLIIVNTLDAKSNPFGGGIKKYRILDKDGIIRDFGRITKKRMASIIAREVKKLLR
ncbi:MAG: phosphopantothenoylcysteine decarboxylase [Candidatus Omnitrophota bacterium]